MCICSIDEWKNLPIFFSKSQFISNSSTDGEKGLKCETGEKVASIYSISQNFKKFNSISFRPLMAKRGENKKWTKNVASIQHLLLLGPPRIQHMHKVLILVVLSSVLALLNALLPLIPSLPLQIAGFVLQIIERVCVLVALCSFLTHV